MSVYNYIKEQIAIDRLSTEINDAGFSTEYLYSTFTSPNLSIFFDGALTSQEQTTLSGLVAAHSGLEIYLNPGMVAVSDGEGSITFVTSALQMSNTEFKFIHLKDAPSTYSGCCPNASIRVNSEGDALEFYNHNSEFPAGTYYNYINDESCSSTTSTDWQQKLKLSVSNLPYGNYRIGFYYEWHEGSTSSTFIGKVQINDSEIIAEANFTPSDSSTERFHPASGFISTTLSGSNYIDVDYKSGTSGKEASIRRTRLEIWRVS